MLSYSDLQQNYLILEIHPKLPGKSQGSTNEEDIYATNEEDIYEHDEVIGQCVILHQIVNSIGTGYHF